MFRFFALFALFTAITTMTSCWNTQCSFQNGKECIYCDECHVFLKKIKTNNPARSRSWKIIQQFWKPNEFKLDAINPNLIKLFHGLKRKHRLNYLKTSDNFKTSRYYNAAHAMMGFSESAAENTYT